VGGYLRGDLVAPMTARDRTLDNLADRLNRLANDVPRVYAHLDEQRSMVSVLAAADYTGARGAGGVANPTLQTATQLESVEYRRNAIRDSIATLAVCVRMLEQDCRTALAFRVSVHDDNLDHLHHNPRCIGNGPTVTAHCDQIPTPRPDGAGGTIDDGRCLDCGRIADQRDGEQRNARLQRRAQNERNRYGRV
jgi:hypothetical protein